MAMTSSIEQQFVSIVGTSYLRPSTDRDYLTGARPGFVVLPADEHQLAAVLSSANDRALGVIPRGGGTKLDWGNAPKKADVVLSTTRLNRIIEHAWADLTVTVEAGCTLQFLQQALAQHGQRLAFDGLWPDRATIGGVLATNDSGALRLRFGALRDLILGITLALPDGTLASSGGKVVKNVAGYDLPKLATGAQGTLGVITRAVFRLHPLPHSRKTLSFSTKTYAAMQDQILAIQDAKLAHTALQIRAGSGEPTCADILFEATEAGLSAQEALLCTLLESCAVSPSSEVVWQSRQNLWNSPEQATIAKITFLPSELANIFNSIEGAANANSLRWNSIAQAMGVASLRLEGQPAQLIAAIQRLRAEREASGGALVILTRPKQLASLDAWGSPGDALALMRAVKHRLDPYGTLNPGRFVGGI